MLKPSKISIASRFIGTILLAFCSFSFANEKYESISYQQLIDRNWNDVWNTTSSIKNENTIPYLSCFKRAAEVNDVPLYLLASVARGESNFDPLAVSHANAVGVMQILWPITAKHLGFKNRASLFDACPNIDAGARYLREMLDRYSNNVHLALAAYNYGPGRIKPGASYVPKGAAWYSEYIYDHAQEHWIVSKDTETANIVPLKDSTSPLDADLKKAVKYSVVVKFWSESRAERFAIHLTSKIPQLNFHSMNCGLGTYAVTVADNSNSSVENIGKLLNEAGFNRFTESIQCL